MTYGPPPTGLRLVVTYVALVVLAGVSWLAADLGTGTGTALAIAGVKVLTIALVFMELSRASSVDRTIALIALGFVLLLCAGAVTDVAFR